MSSIRATYAARDGRTSVDRAGEQQCMVFQEVFRGVGQGGFCYAKILTDVWRFTLEKK